MSTVTPNKSVYKKQGAPLSEAANYQAKLKSGVYLNPSKPTQEVDSKAFVSNAALLAAKSDLSIKPYQRELSKDASLAALAAKDVPGPKPVKINKNPAYSSSAASSANLKAGLSGKTAGKTSSISSTSSYSTSAAKSLASVNPSAHAQSILSSKYKGSDYTNGAIDYHKLNSKAHLNTSGILNAETIKDSRHGLASNKGSLAGSIDYSRLTSSAEKGASDLLSTKLESRDFSLAASGAHAASILGKLAPVEEPKLYSKIDAKVLALAKLNAAKTLDKVSKSNHDSYLYTNVDFNKQAIKIAQQKRAERDANSHAGEYDVGGGLYVPIGDVEAIARRFVSPVLAEIEIRANEQRKLDEEYAQEQERLRQEKTQHDLEVREQKQTEKRELKEEKDGHKQQLQLEKADYLAKKKELEELKEAELTKQKEILTALEQKHELTVQQLNKEKEYENDKLYKELSDFKDSKQKELAQLNGEYAAKLGPILEKLDQENIALHELVAEKEALEKISKSHAENLASSEKLLEKSKLQVESSELRLKQVTLDFDKATDDNVKAELELEVEKLKLEVEHKVTEEKANFSLKKEYLLEYEVTNKDLVKNETELKLKHEALKALEQEKEYATIKPGINDNKIRALEAEIKELERKEQAYKENEARKEFEGAIGAHDATIKELEEQKNELVARENAIFAELKDSDFNWKLLSSGVEELEIEDSSEPKLLEDQPAEPRLEDKPAETKASKRDTFLGRVATNFSKSQKLQDAQPLLPPGNRLRGLSISKLLKKDVKPNDSDAEPSKAKVDPTKSLQTEPVKKLPASVGTPEETNELKHSFTNFTQGSEYNIDEEDLYQRPSESESVHFVEKI